MAHCVQVVQHAKKSSRGTSASSGPAKSFGKPLSAGPAAAIRAGQPVFVRERPASNARSPALALGTHTHTHPHGTMLRALRKCREEHRRIVLMWCVVVGKRERSSLTSSYFKSIMWKRFQLRRRLLPHSRLLRMRDDTSRWPVILRQ